MKKRLNPIFVPIVYIHDAAASALHSKFIKAESEYKHQHECAIIGT